MDSNSAHSAFNNVISDQQWRSRAIGPSSNAVFRYDSTLAVKTISIPLLGSEFQEPEASKKYVNRVKHIQLISGLSHPNVLKYWDARIPETSPLEIVIMMDLCEVTLNAAEGPEGRIVHSLEDFMSLCNIPLPCGVVSSYTRDMLKGLDYLHANNVIHLDLKPGNILLFRSQDPPTFIQAKIGDLDDHPQVRIADKGNDRTLALGTTLRYAAPEQVELCNSFGAMHINTNINDVIGSHCDIWSVGAIVLTMATDSTRMTEKGLEGRQPLRVPVVVQTAAKRLMQAQSRPKHQSFYSKTDIGENIPFAIRDFIQLCFKMPYSERPSAQALLQHWFVVQGSPSATESELRAAKFETFHYRSLLLGTDLLFCSSDSHITGCKNCKHNKFHGWLNPDDLCCRLGPKSPKYSVWEATFPWKGARISHESKEKLIDDLRYLRQLSERDTVRHLQRLMRIDAIAPEPGVLRTLVFLENEPNEVILRDFLEGLELPLTCIRLYCTQILDALVYLEENAGNNGKDYIFGTISASHITLSNEVYPNIYRKAQLFLGIAGIELVQNAFSLSKGYYHAFDADYVAPEVLQHMRTKSKNDAGALCQYTVTSGVKENTTVWGFGMLVLRLLTGRDALQLSDGQNGQEIVVAASKGDQLNRILVGYVPVLPESLPVHLREVLNKCFSRNSFRRCSATELKNHPFFNLGEAVRLFEQFVASEIPSYAPSFLAENYEYDHTSKVRWRPDYDFKNGVINITPRGLGCSEECFDWLFRDLRHLDGKYPIAIQTSAVKLLSPEYLLSISDILVRLDIENVESFNCAKLRKLTLPNVLQLSLAARKGLVINKDDFDGFPKLLALRLCSSVIDRIDKEAPCFRTLLHFAVSPDRGNEWDSYRDRLLHSSDFEWIREMYAARPALGRARWLGEIWEGTNKLCSEYLEGDLLFGT